MGHRPRGTVLPLGLGAGAAVDGPRPRLGTPTGRPPRSTAPGTAPGTTGAPTRVLGLDLAINTTGWCLLVGGMPAAHGTFEIARHHRKGEGVASWLGRRAADLAAQVRLLVTRYSPEVVGYEYPDTPRPGWSGGNKGREFSAVQGLSRAEGFLVAMWPAIGGGVRLVAVPASIGRRSLTGRVGATKDQVNYALRTYRGYDLTGWGEDEVDAAAIALAVREVGL